MSMKPLTDSPAWKALQSHHKEVSGLHLRELFAADPKRGVKFTAEACGLYLDYSKNRVTGQTLELLFDLAEERELRGRIDVAGHAGDPLSRRGSGKMAVTDARMMEFPLGMSFLQLTQLMLPLSDSLDTAKVDFHVRGSDLRFDRLDLTCPTLRMVGSGSLDLATWNLALRFKNRGTVPLISDLFGAASDQLFVIDVTGPVTEPKVNLTPLPPLGGDPSAELPAAQTAAKPMETR